MKHQANFYETIASITKNTPNNMELGTSIRSLINKIEDSKNKEEIKDPNQVTIFQDLENYGS